MATVCNTTSTVNPTGLVLHLAGAISADNAPQVEEDISRLRAEHPELTPTIDAVAFCGGGVLPSDGGEAGDVVRRPPLDGMGRDNPSRVPRG